MNLLAFFCKNLIYELDKQLLVCKMNTDEWLSVWAC